MEVIELAHLPTELLSHMLACSELTPEDLAHADCVDIFHGPALTAALRLRAAALGWPALPDATTQGMLWYECFRRNRKWHGRASAGVNHSAFVHGESLKVAGEDGDNPADGEGPGVLGLSTSLDDDGDDEVRLLEAYTPVSVPALSSIRIQSVAAAWGHTLAVSICGSVFAWGNDYHGRLGLGDDLDFVSMPTQLELPPVALVSADECCSLAVTVSGALYTWGNGDSGQLGHGDAQSYSRPKLVEALSNERVVSASMNYMCAAISAGGCYVWGLGEDDDFPGLPSSPGTIRNSPSLIQGLADGVRLVDVSGRLLLSDTGNVYRVVYDHTGPHPWPEDGTTPYVEQVANLEAERIIAIADGGACEIVITQRGEALMLRSKSLNNFESLTTQTMEAVRCVEPQRVFPGVQNVRAADMSCCSLGVLIAEGGFYTFGHGNSHNNISCLGQGAKPEAKIGRVAL